MPIDAKPHRPLATPALPGGGTSSSGGHLQRRGLSRAIFGSGQMSFFGRTSRRPRSLASALVMLAELCILATAAQAQDVRLAVTGQREILFDSSRDGCEPID